MSKVVIITGSEGTLGSEISRYLKIKKYSVIGIDIKNVKRKNYFKCNINNENQVKKIINKITKKFKKIDVLINCASFNPKQKKLKEFKLSSYPIKNWKKNIEIDTIGTFIVIKHTLKVFEKNNNGKIINISSNYGMIGPDQNIYYEKNKKKYFGKKPVEYSLAKSATIGVTRSMAAFYQNTDINIFCLLLGGITGDETLRFSKDYAKKTIIGRMMKKNEYNKIIENFIKHKSNFLSGSIIDLSGGSLSII